MSGPVIDLDTLRVTEARTVQVKVQRGPRMVNPQEGYLFLPDAVQMKWVDSRLVTCSVFGRRLRTDGQAWIDGRRGGYSYIDLRAPVETRTLDPDTPEWVKELVEKFQPASSVV